MAKEGGGGGGSVYCSKRGSLGEGGSSKLQLIGLLPPLPSK